MGYETGFQATSEDLQIAMEEAGISVGMDEADRLFAVHVKPRLAEVGKAALAGNDLDDQTVAAQAKITEILREAGVIDDAPTP